MLASGFGGTADPSRRIASKSGPHAALEIVGLWTLTILLPLLELIGRDAPFLLHHRPDSLDLVVGLAVLAFGVPALLLLLEMTVKRLAGAAAHYRTHLAVVAVLVVVLLLGMLRKFGDPLPPWALLPVIGALFWWVLQMQRRWPVLGGLFRILAAALPIVLAVFWGSVAARAARATVTSEASRVHPTASMASTPPTDDLPTVVWVVFDELPLLSIVDANLEIDRHLCPNLAAFAETATWYRNAVTVWSSTSESIVSMLTGTVGELRAPPTRDRYPNNLLTWLESTHETRAVESVTSLAPPTAVDLLPRPARRTRLAGLLSDSAVIAAHLVVPPASGIVLPPIDNRWGGFWNFRVVRARAGGPSTHERRLPWAFALADARADQFDDFLASIEANDRPGMFFAHIMLPHMPYRYLPSGRVYGGRPVYGRPGVAWLENEWFALQTYQRHLLQTGYVDRLVGDLVKRLEKTGLWDRTVVVITSDHGVSHWPGDDRRLPRDTDHPDDILRVPLLIKAPHQTEGRIDDRPARTMDALPTIAMLLGQRLPWSTDGIVLAADGKRPSERVLRDPTGGELPFDTTLALDPLSLDRKLELFDPQAGPWRWARLGSYRRLVGTRVDDLLTLAEGDCVAEVDQLPVLETYDPSSRYSPALLTGSLECSRELPTTVFVAVSLNGVIAGTTAVQRTAERRGLYAVMTAETALRPGPNDTALFAVTGPPAAPRLTPIRVDRPSGSPD